MRLPFLFVLSAFVVGVPGNILSQAAPAPTTNTGTQNQQIEYVQNDPAIKDRQLMDRSGPLGDLVDVPSGTLSFQKASDLLDATVCHGPKACNYDDPSTYAAINVIRWNDPSAGTNVQTIASSNWYIFNSSSKVGWWRNNRKWGQADFGGNNRLYGVKQLIVLFVHLNVVKATNCTVSAPSVRYELDIAKRTPSNIAALTQLATLIVPGGDTAKYQTRVEALADDICTGNRYNFWGGRVLAVGYSTSDITIKSTIATATAQPVALAPNYQITSEPRQGWDVSIAVPVKKISATTYSSSSGTVTPSQVNRQNSFAVFDWYLSPVDLVGTTYSFAPHPLFGVSMASQPLHSFLVAMAVGTHFGEIFVGDDFLTQQSGLHLGKNIIKGQFAVGINLPIKGAYASLKKTQ